ncbi:MAG: 5-bromo-4-chloroindolyl phosphate hydrolysis family protein [Granulosicoccaceae bacterium]
MSAAKRYNPDTSPRKVQWRGLLLYILPLPLLPAAIGALMDGSIVQALAIAAGFALAMLAAGLIRKGIRLEQEGKLRRFKRRASTTPYRMLGSVALAMGMFLVAWFGIPKAHGLFDSILYGLAVVLGSYLYYGFDPARKNPDIVTIGITTEELIELLDEADGRIDAIETAGKDIRNAEFRQRLRRIATEARVILDTIEEDPSDARRARKFLKVYLDGAQQVTEGYARTHKNDDNPELEDNFRRVLTTIETVISEQQAKLRENNVSDLDVTIEVLQMQLEKEGVV